MYLVKPGWRNLRMGLTPWDQVNGKDVLRVIEEYGRKCYKSEGSAHEGSAIPFVQKRIQQGHIALLDHLHITAEYVCDRGISHEWLRHKLTEILGSGIVEPMDDFKPMAVCQESTRYCNYMKSGGVVFVIPPWVRIPEGDYPQDLDGILQVGYPEFVCSADYLWFMSAKSSERAYLGLIQIGWTPQMARGELLIKTKTEFIVTCSVTEWRHVMKQRTPNTGPHPQMKELMRPQLLNFQEKLPVLFDDIIL